MKRRSLKRKIQNAIFRSTLLSQLVLAVILLPTILVFLIPLGNIMTRSVAIEISQKYALINFEKVQKSTINASNLDRYSEDELILQLLEKERQTNTTIGDIETSILEEGMKEIPKIIVDPDSTDIKKLIMISQEQYKAANAFLNKTMPLFDVYMIHFKVASYDYALPQTNNALTEPQKTAWLNHFVSQTTNTIDVISTKGKVIGNIQISLNPLLILLILVPYGVIIGFVSLLSLWLISILNIFITKGIIKPILELNRQLKAMAEDDINNLNNYTLDIKKSPNEITEIMAHSNQILLKLNENKRLLENQFDELQTQNDELFRTKEIIQNQQNMLVQSEKMASIGQLSGAIVHEINTPVGAIKSNAQMIQMLDDKEKIKTLNETIIQATNRIITIIKSLKNYSRLDQSEFKESNINEDIESVLLLTSNLWKNEILIEKNLGEIPLVKCFSGLLNQVFMNLIVNAIDAIEHGGIIKISTYSHLDHVIFEIEDNGVGIEPENLERVFEQGYTTKEKNKGSGLGLALSKDIVTKHNGQITVESTKGIKTIFKVEIPINQEARG